jgi:hypothetical protein
MENLGYLRTEYAREQMIKSYDIEASQREKAESRSMKIEGQADTPEHFTNAAAKEKS